MLQRNGPNSPDVEFQGDARGWEPVLGAVPAVEGLLAGAGGCWQGLGCPLTLEYSFWPEVVWQKKVQGKEWSYPV